jgi:hypothetical protein
VFLIGISYAIVDTCHSGTILNLRFLCCLSRTSYWQWENHHRLPERAWEGGHWRPCGTGR